MNNHIVSQKVCSRCKYTCSWADAHTYFAKSKSRKDGYNGWCKQCLKGWREANKEHLRQRAKEYHQANKEHLLEKGYEWRRNNPEKRRASDRKYRRKNLERRNAYNRELYQKKPKVFAEARKRYAVRKKALPGVFTDDDWKFCLEYWNHKCAVCGDQPDTLQADHWVPVSYETADHPGDAPWNRVCLCHSCNSSKFSKDGYFWLVDLYGKPQADKIYARIQEYFDLVREGVIEHESGDTS